MPGTERTAATLDRQAPADPATFFAPAARARPDELEAAVRAVTASPVVSALLRLAGGMAAVLDEHRQILAVNDGLLAELDGGRVQDVVGLRPGEALACVHAHDHPGGCGTGRFCVTCGAAIAIVATLSSSAPAERECLLTLERDGLRAVELKVRAASFAVDGRRLVLLLLQDIRGEKRRQALERVFFHDVMNTLQGQLGCVLRLRLADGPEPGVVDTLHSLTLALVEEIRSQQLLSLLEGGEYRPAREALSVADALADLEATFASHPAAAGRSLIVLGPEPDVELETDPPLVLRVLVNMVRNALEASPPGGSVRVWCEVSANAVRFRVWNLGSIPADVAPRLFQRYFTTKPESGRGLGTFSMRLLGEQHLGGKVTYTTSAAEGTTFELALPR